MTKGGGLSQRGESVGEEAVILSEISEEMHRFRACEARENASDIPRAY